MASSLNDFISKFNSSEQKYIDTIDPLHTFDISFAFWPNPDDLGAKEDEGDILKRIGNSMANAAKGAVKNAANNLTGGLLGSVMNNVDIMKLKGSF